MAKEGNEIPDLTKRRVREQLADETDPKAIKRLTAAREYLEGLSPADIEDKIRMGPADHLQLVEPFRRARL